MEIWIPIIALIGTIVSSYATYRATIDKARIDRGELPANTSIPSGNWRIFLWVSSILLLGITILATYAFVKEEETLSIQSMPFTVSEWVLSESPTEMVWANLSIINQPNEQTKYRLEYLLSQVSEEQSQLGMAFWFSEPQDITAYNFLELSISFDQPDSSCFFDMRDITKSVGSIPIGANVYPENIVVTMNGKIQNVKIPLENYFNHLNKKVISDMGCSASTTFSSGHQGFVIHEIKFTK